MTTSATHERQRPRTAIATAGHWLAAAATAASLAWLSPSAQAHDIVLVPQPSGLLVRYGHPQDWLAVDAEKLLELNLLGPDGAPRDQHDALRRQGLTMQLVRPAGSGPMLAAARYDNGLWVELPAGAGGKPQWRNTSRFMTPAAGSVMLSVKFAKAWQAGASDNGLYKHTVGHRLELVPQQNPLTVRPGDTLPVLVLLDGQPLADAGIENSNLVDKLSEDKIPRYRTNSQGLAQVPVRARGINMLAVDLTRAVDAQWPSGGTAAPAEKVMMVATYTFVR